MKNKGLILLVIGILLIGLVGAGSLLLISNQRSNNSSVTADQNMSKDSMEQNNSTDSAVMDPTDASTGDFQLDSSITNVDDTLNKLDEDHNQMETGFNDQQTLDLNNV